MIRRSRLVSGEWHTAVVRSWGCCLAVAVALVGASCSSDGGGAGTESGAELGGVGSSLDVLTPQPAATAAPDPADGDAPTPITCSPVSPDQTRVVIVPPWTTGVTRELRIAQERSGAGEAASGAGASRVTVSVEAEHAEGWTLRWDADATVLDGLGLSAAVLEEADRRDNLPRQQIRYRVGRSGMFEEVLNVDELRQAVDEALIALAAVAPGGGEGLADSQALVAGLPDQALADIYTEDLRIFHGLEGLELEVGEQVELAEELPNPFGGPPVPAVTTIEILETVDRDGCVSIQARTLPDPDQFLDVMYESLVAAFPKTEVEPGSAELAALVEDVVLDNLLAAQLDPGTGYLRRIGARKVVGDRDQERIETVVLTDVTPGS